MVPNGKKAKHMETPLGMLNMGFTQFYGNQWSKLDYETHRYVWTKGEFKAVLEEIGFSVEVITTTFLRTKPGETCT